MTRDVPAEQDAEVPVPPQQINNTPSKKLITQYFDALIPQIQADPDHVLSLPEHPRVVLVQPTPTGGKFWLGVLMETGFSIRWGKIGTQGTVKHIPLSQCKKRNPALDLKCRLTHKLKQGYDIEPGNTLLP